MTSPHHAARRAAIMALLHDEAQRSEPYQQLSWRAVLEGLPRLTDDHFEELMDESCEEARNRAATGRPPAHDKRKDCPRGACR
jgi:hypothetical protein